ncbi:kelch-like protein 15 [Arctopsyche grandis]|uniref:kelch-like protein 15 n=1 Tax=Arctopsyche grandis TaxID=121162 RepID=UPI00406D851B
MDGFYHHAQMLHGFYHMQCMRIFFTLGMYYDIELIIRDKRYKTHKSILHAASLLFRTKLNQNMRELVMDCKGIHDESIAKAFEFLYKGTVELRQEQIANVIKLAEMWQIDELKKYCYSYLETVCRTNRKVSQKNEKIDDYLLDNFLKITKHQTFLNMSADDVKRLLSSDDLQVSSEEQVFEGLSQWVKHDFINRKNHLYSLMKCIRFPLCSVSFLLEEVMSLCCESVKGCQLLLVALNWHEMPQKRSNLPLMNSKPRNKNKQVLIIGQSFGDLLTIDAYNLKSKSWTDYPTMDLKIESFSTAVFKNNILMFGGRNSVKETHDKAYSFDLNTKALKHLAPMKYKRSESTAAVVNGRTFVMGGYCDEDELNAVEEYDYVENSWKNVAYMKCKRYNHASVVYKENIYVFGGMDDRGCLNSVEVFNIKKNQWKILSPMKWKRRSAAAVVVDDYIYCIGGYGDSSLNNVERYHAESDSWTEVSDLLVEDFGQSAICHDGKIICFGGYCYRSVQEYDPAKDQWRIINKMPTLGFRCGAHVVDLNL